MCNLHCSLVLSCHIVNCFKSSGFDEIDVISEMDIGEKAGNSIEKFIQKKYATCPNHNPFPASMLFEFPPGHRIRICHFVKEVRKLKRSYGSNNPKESTSRKQAHKRPRIQSDDLGDEVLSVADIYKQVRGSVRRWINGQDSDFRCLQEGEDFSINVASNTRSRKVDVSIKCLMCGASTTLHQVKNSFICSNFYRHATLCVKRQNAVNGSKTKFVQSALNFPLSNSSQKGNLLPDKADNQHLIDLTSSTHDKPLSDVATTTESGSKPSTQQQVF